jgi:hypothetical protein
MEENKDSLGNLKANLAEYKLSLDEIPWVIQYNKRDLPNVYTLDELNKELNPGARVPVFEAVATQGKGVFETFRGISHLLMEKVTKDLRRGPGVGSASRSSEASAAPQAAPRPAAVPPPPPPAPARAPEREPLEPSPMRRETDSSVLEYGRELSLPDQIPPSRPAPAAAPPPAPAPVAARIATERPAPRSEPMTVAATFEPERPAPSSSPAAASSTIVVPVTLPPAGSAGEVVIKIVIRPAA